MNDIDDVLLQARDALPEARMETPVEVILSKGRSRRNRRRLAQVSATVAASGALTLGLVAAVVGSGAGPTTIRTAAFTLARNSNGTTTLTLRQDQVFHPAALQRALASEGIPALVQTGIYCMSSPPPPGGGVISLRLPDGSPVPRTGRQSPVPPDAVTVINPAAMTAGTELSFTYSNHDHDLTYGIIYTAAHTCSSTPPAGPRPAG